jgi:hypothetical protein
MSAGRGGVLANLMLRRGSRARRALERLVGLRLNGGRDLADLCVTAVRSVLACSVALVLLASTGPSRTAAMLGVAIRSGDLAAFEGVADLDSIAHRFIDDWAYQESLREEPFPLAFSESIRPRIAAFMIANMRREIGLGSSPGMILRPPLTLVAPLSTECRLRVELTHNGAGSMASLRMRRHGLRWVVVEIVGAPEALERLGL